jgi:hypothetical protein
MQERGIYVACMAGFSRGGDQLGEFQAVVNDDPSSRVEWSRERIVDQKVAPERQREARYKFFAFLCRAAVH